ncbi:unnamed protein product, partial [Tenebrio molitor]
QDKIYHVRHHYRTDEHHHCCHYRHSIVICVSRPKISGLSSRGGGDT